MDGAQTKRRPANSAGKILFEGLSLFGGGMGVSLFTEELFEEVGYYLYWFSEFHQSYNITISEKYNSLSIIDRF